MAVLHAIVGVMSCWHAKVTSRRRAAENSCVSELLMASDGFEAGPHKRALCCDYALLAGEAETGKLYAMLEKQILPGDCPIKWLTWSGSASRRWSVCAHRLGGPRSLSGL